MTNHALLSASSSDRWLNCPPSARLNTGPESTVSTYALEGTEAHELCEFLLKEALGIKAEDPRPGLTMYSEEMERAATTYVEHVMESLEAAKLTTSDPMVFIEQRLDFSEYVPQGFGTADCIVIADKCLSLFDFKYGTGILVDAEKNSQLMLYGLAATLLFDVIYDFDEVRMTIIQPRRDNISTYSISKDELISWAEETVRPIAKLAFEGKGEFKSGKHCQFCAVKATCRERAEANLTLAQYEFREAELLSDEEVADVLDKADDLISWAKDVKEYALSAALSGKAFPGYKLVEGRSNRKYTDEAAVAETVSEAGYEPYEKKLLGITAMTNLLGRRQFNELLGRLVMKPEGKPTLVPVSDKRPAMTTIFDEFKEESIHD